MNVEQRGKDVYRLTISGGYDYDDKQIKLRRTVNASSKKELKKLMTRFQNDYDNGLIGDSAGLTVYGMCKAVLDEYLSIDIAPTTLSGYQTILNRIQPTIGKMKLSKITQRDVQKYIKSLATTETAVSIKRRKKDPTIEPVYLSTKTIRSTYSFLHECFEVGGIWGNLGINPCNRIKLPKTHKKESKALNLDNMPIFIQGLDNLDLDTKVLFELATFCGLRRSEILGLETKHIKDGFIEINQTRHYTKGETIIKDPKTTKSRRTIALPGFINNDIKTLIKEHAEKRLRYGGHYGYSSFLILDDLGEPLKPNRCNDRLSRYLNKLGIEHISFHELRHTHATMINYFGKDLTEISQQLGHSNLTTTLNVYTHMFDEVSHSSKGIALDFDNYFSKVKEIK